MRLRKLNLYSPLERLAVNIMIAVTSFVIRDKDKAESLRQAYIQFFRYCFIGLSNTLLNYFLYVLCLKCIRAIFQEARYDYMAASLIAFSLCVFWSFFWNSRYVFRAGREQRNWLKALVKMYIAYSVTGIFLNNLLLFLYITILGISVYVGPLLSLAICLPVNFLMNKYWAFRVLN